MNRTPFSNRPALFVYGIALTASFLLLPLSASAQTYDDYLLATQKVGETLGEGIKGGVESTKELYQNAWNKLVSLGGAKVAPSLASYADYSNNLGKTFTLTFIAGLGASQEFSQKIWSTDPYEKYASFAQDTGALIAQGIKNGVDGSADIYARSFAKTKQLVQKTPDPAYRQAGLKLAINSDGAANITDVWNSATSYFSNLFKKQPATSNQQPTTPQPVPTQKPPTTKTVTPQAKDRPSPKLPTPAKSGVGTPTASVGAQPTQPLVIQNTVERVLSGVTSADLELKIQQLRNELVSKIGTVAGQSQSNYQNNFAAIALTNKIDQLANTTITTPAITGGTITNASISGGSISGATLTATTGTLSGNLTAATLGVGTTSPSDTFALNGTAYFAQVSAPSVTVNRLYNEAGNLTWNGSVIGGASTGQWTLSGSDVYRSSGNVGIGTTSPYAKLSVVGETVSSYFTATSTTATSTFANHISIGSGKGYRINGAPVLSGGAISASTIGFDNTVSSIGLAVGTSNTSNNIFSVAVGLSNTASNPTTAAFGYSNTASGSSASAFGLFNTASGSNASVFGYGNTATNTQSTAVGFGSNSGGINSSVFGLSSNAYANGSIAIGSSVTNNIASSLMIGPSDAAKLTILSSGNVGIGTTSPYAKLSVVGETVSSYFTATSTTSTSTFNGGFAVGTGASPSGLVYDRSTGYVGIGTSAAERPLEIYSGTGMKIKNPGSNSFYIGLNSDGVNLTAAPNGSGGDNHFNFYTTSSQGCDYQCAATKRMTIRGDTGNVGIGTTSPYAKLSVVGETVSSYFTATSTTVNSFRGSLGSATLPTYSFLGDSNSGIYSPGADQMAIALGGAAKINIDIGSFYAGVVNGAAIKLADSPSATVPVFSFASDVDTGIGNANNNALYLITGGVTALSAISGGNVGIGTTSPYAKLSVVGEVAAQYFTATSTSATTTIAGGLNVGNGAIMYDYSSGVASVGNLELGSLNFDTNAGTVSWMDMPVTSSATVGTVESYSAQIDGTALITAYSQSDGAGNIKLSAVGIGTTTPSARLTVTTATTTELIPLFTIASSTGASILTVNYDGKVGIGTTTSAINNTLVVQGGVCITGGTTCPAVSSGSLSLDTAGAGGGNPGVFDVAERYPAKEVMSAGEIAALDTETDDAAVIKKGIAGDVLLGIVSTRAAVAINGSDLTLAPAGEATSTKPLIALAGRVPVKVTTEGGAIKKGDRITASSVAGVGMKATSTTQQTVGIALEGFSGPDEGTVLVFVQTSTSRLDPAIAEGTILDGNGESSFWSVEEGSGRIKFISQGIDLNDQDIVSVRAIIGSAGKWSIDASGRLVVNEVQTNKLCVGETCVTQDEFKKVFGGSQAAQVSTTPPPVEETAPSSTPPVVIEETSATEETTNSDALPSSVASDPAPEPPPAEVEQPAPKPEPEPAVAEPSPATAS